MNWFTGDHLLQNAVRSIGRRFNHILKKDSAASRKRIGEL